MSRSVKPDYQALISRSKRLAQLEFIQAIRHELRARNAFKEEGTPENLTAWANAKNALEEKKARA